MPLLTPSQTVGPFFAILVPEQGRLSLATDGTPGQRIVLKGSIRDGAGQPVPDALIEIWQANATGRYNHPDDARSYRHRDTTFDGFGRVHADAEGCFAVRDDQAGPGARSRGPFLQAPHLLVGLFARGLLTRLVTRIYFEDEPANRDDPILAGVAPERRPTLVAAHRGEGRYAHAILLQGPGETVFFDV